MAAGPVASVNAGDAQQADLDATGHAVGPQPGLGIDPAARPVGGRCNRAGLVERGACRVAINPGGAAVDQPPHPPAPRQGLHQMGGAQVRHASAGRRRQVQHRVRQAGQAAQGLGLVQVAQQRHRTGPAQFVEARGRRGQRQQPPAPPQQAQHPHLYRHRENPSHTSLSL